MVTGKIEQAVLSRFNPDYHTGLSDRCKLFLGVSNSQVGLTVFDPIKEAVQGIEVFPITAHANPADIEESYAEVLNGSQAGANFDSVYVSLNNPYCTLVPASVFEPQKIRDYLRLNFDQEFTGSCMSDQIDQCDIVAVHHCPASLVTLLQEKYHTISFKHFASTVVESALREYRTAEGPTILAHLSETTMSLTIIDEGELKLFNYFECRSGNDMAYYILHVSEQLKLKPTEVNLILSGEISGSDDSVDLISDYVKEVSLYGNWDGVGLPEFFDQLEKHKYYWPISHIRCEL